MRQVRTARGVYRALRALGSRHRIPAVVVELELPAAGSGSGKGTKLRNRHSLQVTTSWPDLRALLSSIFWIFIGFF